jgi:hypothetical protein
MVAGGEMIVGGACCHWLTRKNVFPAPPQHPQKSTIKPAPRFAANRTTNTRPPGLHW